MWPAGNWGAPGSTGAATAGATGAAAIACIWGRICGAATICGGP